MLELVSPNCTCPVGGAHPKLTSKDARPAKLVCVAAGLTVTPLRSAGEDVGVRNGAAVAVFRAHLHSSE